MDLKQKSIRVKRKALGFDFNEWFMDELLRTPYSVGVEIVIKLQRNSDNLPQRANWSQYIGGVVKGNKPFFFEIEYLKEKEKNPIYLDIIEIDCDDYLDYINKKQILK